MDYVCETWFLPIQEEYTTIYCFFTLLTSHGFSSLWSLIDNMTKIMYTFFGNKVKKKNVAQNTCVGLRESPSFYSTSSFNAMYILMVLLLLLLKMTAP
jgi:hypothetical protein